MKACGIRLGILILLLVFLGGAANFAAAAPSLSDNEKEVLLQEAAVFFRQGNEARLHAPAKAKEFYTKALLRYERLVQDGVRNGKLFYNIGNTCFRLDDIGRAVLNYRRAELFMPDQQELQQNLRFVLSKRVDDIREKPKKKVLKTVFFWHYDIPGRMKAWLFGLFYCCFFVFCCLRWLKLIKVSSWWTATAFLLAGLLLGSLLIERYERMHNRMGVIVDQEIIARKGDGDTYLPSFEEPLHAGTEFRFIEARRGWYHIELMDGNRGWIRSRSGALVIDDSF